MKKFLLLACIALISSITFAQSQYIEVVHLHDGSVIRGVITEQIPDQSIKIETADGNTFVFEMSEIEKFTKEPLKIKTSKSGSKIGYRGHFEAGVAFGVANDESDRFKMDFINGYQLSPIFSLGIGTGIRHFLNSDYVLFPVFADFRINFIDNDISPYLSGGVGYSFGGEEGFPGVGLMMNTTMGVRFMISDKSAINIGMGFDVQQGMYENNPNMTEYQPHPTRLSTSALNLVFGVSF